MNAPPTFWRSPRAKPPLPSDQIEIPAPPPDPRSSSGYANILSMLLPAALMVGVMVLIGRAMGTSNWLMFSVPMMLVSSLAGVITFLLQRRRTNQKAVQREQSYRQILAETEEQLGGDRKSVV